MTHQDAIDLINAELDGELTRDQELQLKKILSSSAEAVAYRNELRDMDALLCNQPDIELPENFHVPFKLNPTSNRAWYSQWIDGLLAYITPMATASVLVVLLSVNLYYYHNQNIKMESLVGSMVSGASDNSRAMIDVETLSSPNFNGQLSLNQQENLYIVTIKTDSLDQINMELDFVDHGLSFTGFAQSDNTIHRFQIENDRLSLSYSGNEELVIFLENTTTAQVLSNNGVKNIRLEYRINGSGQLYNGILGAEDQKN